MCSRYFLDADGNIIAYTFQVPVQIGLGNAGIKFGIENGHAGIRTTSDTKRNRNLFRFDIWIKSEAP